MCCSRLVVLPALLILTASAAVSSVGDAEYVALRRMIGQERYNDAITTCIDLIRDHPEVLSLYEALPEVAQYAGRIDKAVAFFESRVEDGTALPLVYYGLGTAFYSKHDYRTAVVYFNNAIEAGNSTAECYRGLEYAYEKLEGLDAATRYFNLLCHRDPQNPNNWYGLALAYWTRQDYDRVKSCLSEALARRPGERRYIQAQVAAAYLRGETDSVVGRMSTLIATASEELDFGGKEFLKSFVVIGHFNRDRYQSAMQTIEEIINDSKTYGYLRWLGWGYKRMSDVKFLMGEYQLAITFAKEAAAVAEKVGDEELILAALSRQFEVYSEIGDYYDALETAYRKQTVAQESGMNREGIRALGDIAWTLHSLGSDDMALEYAIEAVGRSDAFRTDLRLLYPLQAILGLIYEGLGEYSEAVKTYSYAAKLIPRDNLWRRSMAVSHGRLGRAFLKLNEYKKAELHLSLELRMARAEGYEPEITFAEAYLGMLFLAQGEYSRSRRILQCSYERGCRLNQVLSVLTSARGLSILAEKASRLSEAVLWREKSINANESMGLWHERLMSLTGGNRDLLSDYQEYVRLLCLSGRLDRAFEAAEKAKSLSLSRLVGIPEIEKTTIASDPRRARLLQMQKEIIRLHSIIASGDRPMVPSNSNENTLSLVSNLNHLEITFQRMLDTLRGNDDKLYGLLIPTIHTLRDIQQLYLQPKQSLIEYIVGENTTTIIVVRRDAVSSCTIKVTQRALRELLRRISKVYSEGVKGLPVMNAAIADFDLEGLHEAYELLFQRAIAMSGESTSLTIVPDGVLSNLPFEILVSGWSSWADSITHVCPRFVIGKYDINYSLSASTDLNLCNQVRHAPKLILAIGDAVTSDRTTQSAGRSATSKVENPISGQPRSFPGVRRELGAIRNIFGNEATVLSRSNATTKRFNLEASQYRILHLAAHVDFDESRPLYSMIALSNDADDGGSNGLRAIDFLSIHLNADLVVLSGCNTGRLSSQSGSVGMTSSIMISGVPSVIASLWNVDDEVTASLMETFYTYLKNGAGRAEALRNAKLDMIKSGRSDPFYWGAFVLCGDCGKIAIEDVPDQPPVKVALIPTLVGFSAASVVLIILFWREHKIRRKSVYD
jgi:tetratricopeptide (TPR) repeat protein